MNRTRRNLSALLLLWFAPACWGLQLTASNPWIRAAPPNSKMLAGYVALINSSQQAVTITGLSSTDFASVEMHVTRIENNMARMEQVAKLVLPAGGEVRLEPSGRHLMLLAPNRKLGVGDTTPIRFSFSDGTHQDITFTVREYEPTLPAADHDHTHGALP